MQFALSEMLDDKWKETVRFMGPSWRGNKPENEPGYRLIFYTPKSSGIKIDAIGGGFYIQIYQMKTKTIASSSSLIEKINKLIEDLANDSFMIRERATDELIKIGEPALITLKKTLNSDDLEVKTRSQMIINTINKSNEQELTTQRELNNKIRTYLQELLKLQDDQILIALKALSGHCKDSLKNESRIIIFLVSQTDNQSENNRRQADAILKDIFGKNYSIDEIASFIR